MSAYRRNYTAYVFMYDEKSMLKSMRLFLFHFAEPIRTKCKRNSIESPCNVITFNVRSFTFTQLQQINRISYICIP